MDFLRINKMEEPNQWWKPIFDWLRDNTIVLTSFALAWKGIDKVFKYFSEARDGRTRSIVKEEVKPLEDKIDHLTDMFYDLKIKK